MLRCHAMNETVIEVCVRLRAPVCSPSISNYVCLFHLMQTILLYTRVCVYVSFGSVCVSSRVSEPPSSACRWLNASLAIDQHCGRLMERLQATLGL